MHHPVSARWRATGTPALQYASAKHSGKQSESPKNEASCARFKLMQLSRAGSFSVMTKTPLPA